MVSTLHIICGAGCLVLGAFVLFNVKRTRMPHRIGAACVVAVLVLNVTALFIYHLTGRFNLFHFFAILSLALVLIGRGQVLFRPRFHRWFYRRSTYMSWSYAGLIAATTNEAFVRVPALTAIAPRCGKWIILATQAAILGFCAILLSHNKARLHQKYATTHINQLPAPHP